MRMISTSLLLALVSVAACSKNSQPPDEGQPMVRRAPVGAPPPAGSTEQGPTAHASTPPMPSPPTPVVVASTVDGKGQFLARCAGCHGRAGGGDGLMAGAFPVRPRTFADAAWQASVTDAQIAAIIVGGSASVGKSAYMPAAPDLATQPALVAALVAVVRGLAPAK